MIRIQLCCLGPLRVQPQTFLSTSQSDTANPRQPLLPTPEEAGGRRSAESDTPGNPKPDGNIILQRYWIAP